jgi:hypothetical protein
MGGGTVHHTIALLTSPLMKLLSMTLPELLSGRFAMLNVISSISLSFATFLIT